jgi:hypothetical protein
VLRRQIPAAFIIQFDNEELIWKMGGEKIKE